MNNRFRTVFAGALLAIVMVTSASAQVPNGYDPRFDINNDGVMDIRDVTMLSTIIQANYGAAAQATPASTPTATPTTQPAQPTLTPTTPPHMGAGFDCSLPASQRMYVCAGDVALPPATVPNLAGQSCPQWAHDQHLVSLAFDANGWPVTRRIAASQIGGGVAWRTWHPVVDTATGCIFSHSHHDDPRLSKADPSWPAFGWEAHQAGMVEPHAGFKVSYANAGDTKTGNNQPNGQPRAALNHSRIVFHMGTSGLSRTIEQFHSFAFVVKRPDGSTIINTRGMLDTALMGNICERPTRDQGRTLAEPAAQCNQDNGYEIWTGDFAIETWPQEWSTINFSMSTQNPATVLDRTSGQVRVVPNPRNPLARGCDIETYHGSIFLRSYGAAFDGYTNAYGEKVAANVTGAMRQFIAQGRGAVRMNTSDEGGTSNIYLTETRNPCDGLEQFIGPN